MLASPLTQATTQRLQPSKKLILFTNFHKKEVFNDVEHLFSVNLFSTYDKF